MRINNGGKMSRGQKDATAKTVIYNRLRSEIITGRKKPGERLSIEALKTAYGTSVTPVRDALQMLNQETLVTIKPRSGYYVAHITLKNLHDMLDLREILETAAVERALENITPEQLEQLENIHAGYTGDDEFSYTRYTDENRQFHYIVAQSSGNQELASQLGHLLDRMARFMVIRRAGKNLADIHKPLIKAFKKKDAMAARQAICKELKDTKIHIMDRIMQEEAGSWHLGMGPDNVT